MDSTFNLLQWGEQQDVNIQFSFSKPSERTTQNWGHPVLNVLIHSSAQDSYALTNQSVRSLTSVLFQNIPLLVSKPRENLTENWWHPVLDVQIHSSDTDICLDIIQGTEFYVSNMM